MEKKEVKQEAVNKDLSQAEVAAKEMRKQAEMTRQINENKKNFKAEAEYVELENRVLRARKERKELGIDLYRLTKEEEVIQEEIMKAQAEEEKKEKKAAKLEKVKDEVSTESK